MATAEGQQTDTQGDLEAKEPPAAEGQQTNTQGDLEAQEPPTAEGQQTDTQGDLEAQEPTRTGRRDSTLCSRCMKKLDDCTLGTFSIAAIIIFGVITVCLGLNTFVSGSTYILGALLCLIGGMLVAGASYLCCKHSDKHKTLPSNRLQNRRGRPMRGQAANTSNVSPSDEQSHPLVLGSRPGTPHAAPVIVPGQPGYTVLVPDPERPGSYLLVPYGHGDSPSVPRGHVIPTAPTLARREDDLPPAYEDVVKNPPVS